MRTFLEKHKPLNKERNWCETEDSYLLTVTAPADGPMVEGDLMQGASAPLATTTSEIKLLKTDIAALIAAPANAYTVWTCFEEMDGVGRWRNVYEETLTERMPIRTFFSRIANATAYALLIVPPAGMESVLSLTIGTGDAVSEPWFVDEVIDRTRLSSLFSDTMPVIRLSVADYAPGLLQATATATHNGTLVDITGTDLRWEATAGLLDASRSTFSGNTTSVLLQKPISEQPFKIKCGFKYFAGVAEVMVGG